MISHEEALKLLRQHVRALGTEEAATAECAGRVLAEDVVARLAGPPFDKAAMDGFAVRSTDVAEPPAELRLAGESFAGRWPDFSVGPGECARITTGAPVPPGADMVVMVEHTRETPDGAVRIEKPTGANICPTGEDIREGQIVLRRGLPLTPMRVGVAASVGYGHLKVYRKPSIALLCTGTEVVEPPGAVPQGRIYNSNGPMVSALLAPLAGRFEYLGIVGDREEDMERAFRQGLESDLLVVTGGVSMGQFDLVPALLERCGVRTVFHKCAVKPGKPVLFGSHAEGCAFGLPGNPQSCFVGFHVFLRPALALMSGATELPPAHKTGRMAQEVRNRPGRKTFKPCRIEVRGGVNYVVPVPYRGSADIMGASAGDAYFVVPREAERIEKDELVEFFEV